MQEREYAPVNAGSADGPQELRRRLGPVTGVAVVVGVIIGSGIFWVASPIAAAAGNITGITVVWVVGGVVALCGALSIAELSAMYPEAGGPYVYLREAYGRPLAFLFGWMWLLSEPASWAVQALVFAEYLGFFVPLSAAAQHLIAAALIVVVAAANCRSVKLGVMIQNLSTGAKVLAIVGLSIVIFFFAPGGAQNPLTAEPMGVVKWSGVGLGLVTVLWAYDGWESMTTLSGEVRNPQRNLPLSLIGGVIVVMLVYLLINAAYLRALPLPQVVESKFVATAAANAVLGRTGASLVGALVMLSVFGSLNGTVLADPRVFYAMSKDKLFFKIVGRIHPRFETPYVATGLIAALAVAYVLMRNFVQLADAYVLGVWPFLALCAFGLFVLRRRHPDFPRRYRVPGYPVVPALFIIGTAVVVVNSLYAQFWSTLASILLTLVGVPMYFLWMWWQRRMAQARTA